MGQRDVLVGEVDLSGVGAGGPEESAGPGDDDKTYVPSSSSSARFRVWISGPQVETLDAHPPLLGSDPED